MGRPGTGARLASLGALALLVGLGGCARSGGIPPADPIQGGLGAVRPGVAQARGRGLAGLLQRRPSPTEGLPAAVIASPGAGRIDWPVTARVASPYGRRDGHAHEGIDLPVPDGTPVRAAAAGEVVYAGSRLRGYGNLLILRHDARLATVYAHNERLLVGEGEAVARGQVIALSGRSGRVTAPHLHFEVRIDGLAVDPAAHLAGPVARAEGAQAAGQLVRSLR